MEVCEYMTSRGYPNPADEAERFIAHYGRTDWQTRNGKLTNWKAAVDGWSPGKPSPARGNSESNPGLKSGFELAQEAFGG